MKLILTHEVTGLGEPGDTVEVKDGYARNFLLPRSLATPWTKGGEKQVEAMQKAREQRRIADLDDAKGLKGQLESKVVRIKAQAGSNGRLFGKVTSSDVAEATSAMGMPIDRRKVEFTQPIKSTGMFECTVRLHPEVSATLKLDVAGA